MVLKKGDLILLDNEIEVEVVWSNDELIQVAYKDLTRRLLKRNTYKITKK